MQITANIDTPKASAQNTKALLSDQGFTYNEAGKTYNEAGMTYGGVYNYQEDIVPTISQAENPFISARAIAQSSPFIIANSFSPKPSISGYSDIYTPYVAPSANSGMLIGMLGLTYI